MVETWVEEKVKRKKEQKEHSSLLTENDLYLFNEGSHFRLYEKLGCREAVRDETKVPTSRSGSGLPTRSRFPS
jgi:hypothetical protein